MIIADIFTTKMITYFTLYRTIAMQMTMMKRRNIVTVRNMAAIAI